MIQVLAELVSQLRSGALRVIDLTQPLCAETPLLPLPPQSPNTPAFRIWEISRYDERGPAWYWNGFRPASTPALISTRRFTGSPARDLHENSVNQVHPAKFIGPACVIDVAEETERDPDFLLNVDRIERWGSGAPPNPRRSLAVCCGPDGRSGPTRSGTSISAPTVRIPRASRRKPRNCWRGRAMCWASGWRRWGRMRAAPPRSIRRFRITASCTAAANSATPVSATWIDSRRPARS